MTGTGKTGQKAKRSALQIVFGRTMVIMLALAIHFLILFAFLLRLTEYLPYLMGGVTVMTAAMLIYILNTRDDPSLKLSWCVLVAVFPTVGVMLYFYVKLEPGHKLSRKLNEKTLQETAVFVPPAEASLREIQAAEPDLYPMAQYLNRFSPYGICRGEDMAYYPLGDLWLPQLLQELKKAERFIFLEYFIISQGTMWEQVLSVLREKAQRGVEVRVMYDGTCTFFNLPAGYHKQLEKWGIHCREFSPMTPFLSTHHNNRDHRKIAVIDGVTAFTGGVNLADEYINVTHPYGHWKDTAVMVRGQAARSFTLMFLQMWNILEKKPVYTPYLQPVQEPESGRGWVIPFADTPTDTERVGQTVYMTMINQAKNYVYIMTPYLILDGEMVTALCQCAKRGVDIRIVQPQVPDHKYAYVLARRHYRELMEAGVKIYAYTPGFVHAKVFLADGRQAVVGTVNLDYRSLYLHYECGAYFYKTPLIMDIRQDFQETFALSHALTTEDLKKESFLSRLCGVLLKVVAPLM